MPKFHNLYCLIIILLFASIGFAQNQSSSDTPWIRFKDDKLDFSILFPPNYLVDNEIEKSYILSPRLASLPAVVDLYEKPKIIGNEKSVRMTLSVLQLRPVSNAKDYLWYFLREDSPKDSYQDFQSGDFVGRKTSNNTEKTLGISIIIAVKNKVYAINASAKKEDKKTFDKFVMSLMLNGNSVFKGQNTEPADASQTVLISPLKTSPEILEVLKRKQDKSEIKVIKNTAATVDPKEEEQNFSRPLILLRRPLAEYPNAARMSKTSGLVRLKVTFLASGKIGDITVVSELPNGLTESAIKAVQKIKFLPAEIDEKKVDITRAVEYSFGVS